MPRHLMLASLVISAMTLAGPAGAATLFEEDFNYGSTDELVGKTGGTGLAGAWAGNTSATQLTNTTFDYNVADGGTIVGGNGALRVGGTNPNSTALISRSLETAYSGDAIYVRYLLTVTGGTIDQADRIAVWFNSNTALYFGSLPLNVGGDFVVRPSGSTSAQVLGGGDLNANQTYLLVARFSKTNSGAANPYDRADLWINPAFGDMDNPTLSTPQQVADTVLLINSITSVGIETVNMEVDDVYIIDALKAGTTWEDVVPVPEPATGALIGAGLMLGMSGRRLR
jgi:hypothetical protein